MSPREEAAVVRLWQNWSAGKKINNQTCTDFYFDVVRHEPPLAHVNAFEVLDVLVNQVPMERAV